MKQGNVYFKNILAGTIREDEDGFTFQYDPDYLQRDDAPKELLVICTGRTAYLKSGIRYDQHPDCHAGGY